MNLRKRIRAAFVACDPMRLIKLGAPQDEYNTEADDVALVLMKGALDEKGIETLCRSVCGAWFGPGEADKIDYEELTLYVQSAYGENKCIKDGADVKFFPHLEEHIRKYGNCSVHVVKELGWECRDAGETPRMFEVIFPDGETGHACEEELVTKTWSYNGDKTY